MHKLHNKNEPHGSSLHGYAAVAVEGCGQETMKDPTPSQFDPSRDTEPVTLQSVCVEIDSIATHNRLSKDDTPDSKGGRSHQMPDYDLFESPYSARTDIEVALLTKEGQEPVRLVYQLA